ncbi:hypothetical protein OUZ56_023477 [Daphnia magna]|uniref:Endonuclease/exonuclease/phosphatase domain-containing protein n=1 Tax=Daphnia magna TaxID=35525 RepID=A0ABR0AZ72_9CRUS|nr:hypothetical protein OUZ56_023477 [Daphnia magna]
MESMEPDTGKLIPLIQTKLRTLENSYSVPRSKRFKPTLTPQNSKPTSGIPVLKNLTHDFTIKNRFYQHWRDGNLDIVGLQEVAFHSGPIIESCYHLLANVGPNKK